MYCMFVQALFPNPEYSLYHLWSNRLSAHNPSNQAELNLKGQQLAASSSLGVLASGVNSECVSCVAVPSLFRAQHFSQPYFTFHSSVWTDANTEKLAIGWKTKTQNVQADIRKYRWVIKQIFLQIEIICAVFHLWFSEYSPVCGGTNMGLVLGGD